MAKAMTIDTTLGELIVALTEEARPLLRNEQDTYRLVALILTNLLGQQKAPLRLRQYRHREPQNNLAGQQTQIVQL